MIEKTVTIRNKQGIHARPSAKIAQICMASHSQVTIEANGNAVQGISVISVLSLGAVYGDQIKLIVDGKDEEDTMNALIHLIEVEAFGEEV